MAPKRGLRERLAAGDYVICAEGYLFEFERRGYLKAGHFAPEVVLEHPDLVKNMHEEFVHCGSDVVQAFTYYGHRQKLKIAGREDDVERLNKQALRIAKEVADRTGTLLAGNICNTTVYTPGNKETDQMCEQMFKEQLEWAIEANVDFIIAETFMYFGEAQLAMKCLKKYAPGVPCVVNLAPGSDDKTFDGFDFPTSLQKLEAMGADVVGLNCFRGPDSMEPLMKEVKQKCKGPLACLPVPYRTTMQEKCMQNLRDQKTGKLSFPVNLDSWLCSRDHIQDFTEKMKALEVKFIGVCCGNRAGYIRTMAETLGRSPPASKYSPDMTKHMSQIQGTNFKDNIRGWHRTMGTEGPQLVD